MDPRHSEARSAILSQIIAEEWAGDSPISVQLPRRSSARTSSGDLHSREAIEASPSSAVDAREGCAQDPGHIQPVLSEPSQPGDLQPPSASTAARLIRQQLQDDEQRSALSELPHRSLGTDTITWTSPFGSPCTQPESPPARHDAFGNLVDRVPLLSARTGESTPMLPSGASSVCYSPADHPGEVQIDGVESQLTPLTMPPLELSQPCLPQLKLPGAAQEGPGHTGSERADSVWSQAGPDLIQVDLAAWGRRCGGSSRGKTLLVHTFGQGEHGRFIVLAHTAAGELFALDGKCHHMGGALWEADIEELPGQGGCLRCPWHKRLIQLSTGAVLEAGAERIKIDLENLHVLNLRNPLMPPQRTHTVRRSGDRAEIWVGVEAASVAMLRVQLAIRGEQSQGADKPGTDEEACDSDHHAAVNCTKSHQVFVDTEHQLNGVPVQNLHRARVQSSGFRIGGARANRTQPGASEAGYTPGPQTMGLLGLRRGQ